MKRGIGRRVWAISCGEIPLHSRGDEPEWTSRDMLVILNAGPDEAAVSATIAYEDRAPVGPYEWKVPPQRVRRIWINALIFPEAVPLGQRYSVTISTTVPVVVSFTRLDSGVGARQGLTVPFFS